MNGVADDVTAMIQEGESVPRPPPVPVEKPSSPSGSRAGSPVADPSQAVDQDIDSKTQVSAEGKHFCIVLPLSGKPLNDLMACDPQTEKKKKTDVLYHHVWSSMILDLS